MKVSAVLVYVKDNKVEDFIAATRINHEHSLTEPGNMRFDVLQSIDAPQQFMLYEAYESEEAAANHKKTAHYQTWKDTVAPWMEKPREGIHHNVLFPSERAKW